MARKITISLNRSDTYSHLVALCNQDATYGILQANTEQDLESLTVCDYQAALQNNGSQHGTIIGTLRLLPLDNSTAIIFEDKDALWHLQISSQGTKLFHKFEELVKDHFSNFEHSILMTDVNKFDKQPFIPKQQKRLNDWKVRWRKVKPEWEKGGDYKSLSRYLSHTCDLPTSPRSLSDIIKAGEAHLLD